MGCCSSRTEEEREIVIEEIDSNGPQAQEPAAGADPNPAAGANPDPANDGIFVVGEIPRAPWEPPKEQDAQPVPNWQPRPQEERRAGTPRAPDGRQRNYVVIPAPALRPMPQDGQSPQYRKLPLYSY
ncbi:unnamed protein product [Caenorhabditis nigoni]